MYENEHPRSRTNMRNWTSMHIDEWKQRICVVERFIHNERTSMSNEFTNKVSDYSRLNVWKRTCTNTNEYVSPRECSYRMNGQKHTNMYKRTVMRNEQIRIERVHNLRFSFTITELNKCQVSDSPRMKDL